MLPYKVYKAFKSLSDIYGDKIEYLGNKNNTDYYYFRLPDNEENGFPNIVSFKNNTIAPIEDIDALKILNLFNAKD